MSILNDLIMNTMDLGTKKKVPSIQLSQTISDWNLQLTNKREVPISDIVKNGPLLIIFIRGTWCPFCRMHMNKLRNWVKKLSQTSATIIVVSSEPAEKIREWLRTNSFPYLFASDEKSELADHFGVRIRPNDFSQAATFLIDSNLSVRLAYTGKRSKKNYVAMEEALKSV
ncbi:MAG: hypothetical protein BM556_03060 [Bacteriovorax sp. MedPE-SWde]|nr:MAG: hypothetical protein BM556_03060 [Bacteriovorax sp. MedPE-SWde]